MFVIYCAAYCWTESLFSLFKSERLEKFQLGFVISHQFANFLKIDTAQKDMDEDKKSFLSVATFESESHFILVLFCEKARFDREME